MPSTQKVSLVQGNCTGAVPVKWQDVILQPLAAGACAVFVEEGFLLMDVGMPELWLHNLYIFEKPVPNPSGEAA